MTNLALQQFERELDAFLKQDIQDKPLFHYTSAEGFLGIVQTGEIHATHFRHLNDRAEILRGERVLHEEIQRLQGEYEPNSPQAFILERVGETYDAAKFTTVANIFIGNDA